MFKISPLILSFHHAFIYYYIRYDNCGGETMTTQRVLGVFKLILIILFAALSVNINASPINKLLLEGEKINGMISAAHGSWPFYIEINNYDEVTGKFDGVITWTTLKGPAYFEGTSNGSTIQFTTTKFVKNRGRAILGCTYTLSKIDGDWLLGGWVAPDRYKGRFTKRQIKIHLNPGNGHFRIGQLTLVDRIEDIESIVQERSVSTYIAEEFISNITIDKGKYYVNLSQHGQLSNGPEEYYDDFKSTYDLFAYYNSDYQQSKTWVDFKEKAKNISIPAVAYKIDCQLDYNGICGKLIINNDLLIQGGGFLWVLGSGLVIEAVGNYKTTDPAKLNPEIIAQTIQSRNATIKSSDLYDANHRYLTGKTLKTPEHQFNVSMQNDEIILHMKHQNLSESLEEADWAFIHSRLAPYLRIWDSNIVHETESELLETSDSNIASGF